MAAATAAALNRWRASGRKLVLATGESVKKLAELPELQLFDLVVAENGALLYWPASRKRKLLVEPRPQALLRALRRRKIPLTVGQVIIGTKRPYDGILRATIAELQLEWCVIYNRKDAMALPPGVDKASGVRAALKALRVRSKVVVGVGDAENDEALLKCCGVGAAMGNAVGCLKKNADIVMAGGSGTGVVRLIDFILGEAADV